MKINLLLIGFLTLIQLNGNAQFSVNFSASTLTSCAGESIQFTDLSIAAGGVVSWVWDFGDGNASTLQNPSHAYTSPGTYTVILTANNGSVSLDEVKVNYIVVHPLPQPSFLLSNPPCQLPASVSISSVSPSSGVSYAWNFGNGQTSTQQNPPSQNYTSEGAYTVQLSVTNNTTGCTNSVTKPLNIINYTTSFTSSASTVCVGSTVEFTDASSPGTNSYSWNFGNGYTASTANPNTTYSTAGTYTVTLTTQNTVNGCSDVATQTITVVNAQLPSLSPSLTIGCNPSTVVFTNTTPFAGTFTWNFGNGSSYVGPNPPPQTYFIPTYNTAPLYPMGDSFNVILHAVDENGCSSYQIYTDLIKIYNIRPAFHVDVREGCEDLLVTFMDNSYSPIPGFPINSWQWTFGNGQTYNGQNPPIQLFSEGVYDVSLTVSTAMGCETTVDSLGLIKVGILPTVLFTVEPDTLCARQRGTFVNLSSVEVPSDPQDFNYYWYIGSNGPFMDFEPNGVPIVDTGWLDVRLIVSFRGCRDTLTLHDEIFVHAPLVNFGSPGLLCNPSIPVDVTFQDNSILGRQGDSVEVYWEMGDGTTFTFDNAGSWQQNNQELIHTYSNYGEYGIKQIVTNFDTGCTDSFSVVVTINYFNVNLSFVQDSVCHGDTSIFHWDFESIPEFNVSQYHYYADNTLLGYSYDPLVSNPHQHYFPDVGLHQIFVSVTNERGCEATRTQTLTVAPLPEAIIASIDIAGCIPTTAVLTDGSTSHSGIPIVNFDWTLNGVSAQVGNGQPTIVTSIDSTGIFVSTLEVTDALGCIGSTTVFTEVLEPLANFTLPPVVCNNTIITIPNLSTNYTFSEWYVNGQLASTNDEGDFSISHPINATVLSYIDSIRLVVTDVNGCSSELILPVITSCPHASFSYSFTGSNLDELGNFACPSVFTAFTNTSQSIGDISSYSWAFGDGKFSSLQHPNNTYVFAGTYTASLTITDEYGCKDSVSYADYLTINGPSGTFDIQPAGTLCDPNYLFSVVTLNNVTSVEWFTGDGESFHSLTEEEYIYANSGTYYPYVILTDDNNCTITYFLDTLTIQFGNLHAAFIATPLLLNWGEPLLVTNNSSGGNGGIVSNDWSFGSDHFDNPDAQFNYLFNEAGEIIILLIVTDAIGCKDSAWITVLVTDDLELPNVFSPNGDGLNDVFRIRDNAYGEYEVVILNRWGNEMSRSYIVDDDYLWDGRTQGGALATEGVYYYYIRGKLRDGKPNEDHGFFHLVMPK